jgi:hypothetical protein
MGAADGRIPMSDGAGVVEATGVARTKPRSHVAGPTRKRVGFVEHKAIASELWDTAASMVLRGHRVLQRLCAVSRLHTNFFQPSSS